MHSALLLTPNMATSEQPSASWITDELVIQTLTYDADYRMLIPFYTHITKKPWPPSSDEIPDVIRQSVIGKLEFLHHYNTQMFAPTAKK
jgi:hypothetical protein